MSGQRVTDEFGDGVVEEVWRSSDLSDAEAVALADDEKHAAREQQPSDVLVADLSAISQRAAELGVESDATDFDVSSTIDDQLG